MLNARYTMAAKIEWFYSVSFGVLVWLGELLNWVVEYYTIWFFFNLNDFMLQRELTFVCTQINAFNFILIFFNFDCRVQNGHLEILFVKRISCHEKRTSIGGITAGISANCSFAITLNHDFSFTLSKNKHYVNVKTRIIFFFSMIFCYFPSSDRSVIMTVMFFYPLKLSFF